MLIDAHAHAYTSKDIEVILDRTRGLDGGLPDSDPNKWAFAHKGSLEGLLEAQQRAGIQRFVLLPLTSNPKRVREINKWVLEEAKKINEMIPFGTLLPTSPLLKGDLKDLLGLGFKGLKLHPFLQQFSIDSKEAYYIYRALEEAGLVLVLDTMNMEGLKTYKPHLAWLADMAQPFSVTPNKLARIAKDFPRLIIVATHMGCLYHWHGLEPLFELPNVYFDLSFVAPILPEDRILHLMEMKGFTHILFGTDAPWRHPQDMVNWFLNLPLSREEKDMIGCKNLALLLGMELG